MKSILLPGFLFVSVGITSWCAHNFVRGYNVAEHSSSNRNQRWERHYFERERLPEVNERVHEPIGDIPVGINTNIPESPEVTNTAPSTTTEPTVPVPMYQSVMTTVFWVGEPSSADNNFIPNDQSAWDSQWQAHYGGVDDADDRCGYRPCSFSPKENPFYVALPYNDLTDEGARKASASSIPWFGQLSSQTTVLKNQWLEIVYEGTTCYAQWEDVGPNETDDFAYVFQGASPVNTFGERAGLDVSPAVQTCLKMTDNAVTQWRFIAANAVPAGPWKEIVTTSKASWE